MKFAVELKHKFYYLLLAMSVTPGNLSYQAAIQSHLKDTLSTKRKREEENLWEPKKKIRLYGCGSEGVFCSWEIAAATLALTAQSNFEDRLPNKQYTELVIDSFYRHFILTLIKDDTDLAALLLKCISKHLGYVSLGAEIAPLIEQTLSHELVKQGYSHLVNQYQRLNVRQKLLNFLGETRANGALFHATPLSRKKIVIISGAYCYNYPFTQKAIKDCLKSQGFEVVSLKIHKLAISCDLLSNLGISYSNGEPITPFSDAGIPEEADSIDDSLRESFPQLYQEVRELIHQETVKESPFLIINTANKSFVNPYLLNLPCIQIGQSNDPVKFKKIYVVTHEKVKKDGFTHWMPTPVPPLLLEPLSSEEKKSLEKKYKINKEDKLLFILAEGDVKKWFSPPIKFHPDHVFLVEGRNKIPKKSEIRFNVLSRPKSHELFLILRLIKEYQGKVWSAADHVIEACGFIKGRSLGEPVYEFTPTKRQHSHWENILLTMVNELRT